MSRFNSFVALTIACCLFAPGARAQQADSVRASAVGRLPQGRHILVMTAGEGVEGRFAGVREGSLVLEARDERPARTIPLANIDTVWTAGNNAGRGFLIGGVAGALVGGVAAAAAGHALSQSTGDRCNCSGAPVTGAIGGALIGGLLGALFGAMSTSWHRVVPQ